MVELRDSQLITDMPGTLPSHCTDSLKHGDIEFIQLRENTENFFFSTSACIYCTEKDINGIQPSSLVSVNMSTSVIKIRYCLNSFDTFMIDIGNKKTVFQNSNLI